MAGLLVSGRPVALAHPVGPAFGKDASDASLLDGFDDGPRHFGGIGHGDAAEPDVDDGPLLVASFVEEGDEIGGGRPLREVRGLEEPERGSESVLGAGRLTCQ
jgi:hypothetical protein